MRDAFTRVIDSIESDLRAGWITPEMATDRYWGVWAMALEMELHGDMPRPSEWIRMQRKEAA